MEDVTSAIKESQEAVAALVPDNGRVWKLQGFDQDGQPTERQYIQEELGFFPKQEFINLLTEEIEKFVKGDYGIKIGDLFRGDTLQQLRPPDLSDANDDERSAAVEKAISDNIEIINAFLHVVRILPGLQKEIIALGLGVKRGPERDWFKWAIAEPPSRGGLSDAVAFDILKTFIRQNAKAIRGFFEERAVDLFKEVQAVLDLGSSTSVDSTATETGMEEEEPPAPEPDTPGGMPSSTSSPATPTNA